MYAVRKTGHLLVGTDIGRLLCAITGWTAGLLAWRLGDRHVVTVEVDADVAARASANLSSVGLRPRVITGDGALGFKDGQPYDLVDVTCGVDAIPYTWVEQARPGGTVVLPWMPGWAGGHLTKLVVQDGAAAGRFHGECGFMPLRAQRHPDRPFEGDVRESQTSAAPSAFTEGGEGLAIAIAGLLPGVNGHGVTNADGSFRVAARDDESHALATFPPHGKGATVRQRGPRNLFDELEVAVQRWVAWGRPGKDRFGLTVSRDGQYVWLDDSSNPVKA
ncbi:hypothetical protein GCM10010191_66820 [Actinomadura vinacea]|uniref:Protein-L-isoaspartate O-methyltransferase n=1 Tax=Actinomadura vinacea TaxID=115336 RepID=A0ABN3JY20_9ACTN